MNISLCTNDNRLTFLHFKFIKAIWYPLRKHLTVHMPCIALAHFPFVIQGPWILGQNFDLKVKNPDFDGPELPVCQTLRALD